MKWLENIKNHQIVFEQLQHKQSDIDTIVQIIIQSLRNNGRIFIAGNGGSAADAQHFAAELTGRYVKERRSLAGIALTTDTSALTAIGNDYGFDRVFARQLEGLGRKNDVFIGISTSGNSSNILEAFIQAKELGIKTIALTGRDGGKMTHLCDGQFIVPSHTTSHIQEAHIFLIHYICECIDQEFH